MNGAYRVLDGLQQVCQDKPQPTSDCLPPRTRPQGEAAPSENEGTRRQQIVGLAEWQSDLKRLPTLSRYAGHRVLAIMNHVTECSRQLPHTGPILVVAYLPALAFSHRQV